jgi:hypothetical protein
MKSTLLSLLTCLVCAGPQKEPEHIGFAVLAGFDYEAGKALPAAVTKLDKQKVKVSGFMMTEDGSEGPTEYFVIVNDACGCEGTPKLNEMVFCAMPEGEKTKIRPGNVSVTGTLYVGEEKEEGVVVSLYGLSVDSIE